MSKWTLFSAYALCTQLKFSNFLCLKSKETAEWSQDELEGSVSAIQHYVEALEYRNLDEPGRGSMVKYDNQGHLEQQQRWLEHELEQVVLP